MSAAIASGSAAELRAALEAFHQPLRMPTAVGEAFVPALSPARLGDAAWARRLDLKAAYMCGAMANGIASVPLVVAAAKAGYLASFGAAGLDPRQVAAAVDELQSALPDRTFSVNLIHSPAEPATERELVALFAQRRLKVVEASAFLDLTRWVVKLRAGSLREEADGRIGSDLTLLAKVSRQEVATKFLAPAPTGMLDDLLRTGDIDVEQHRLAQRVPVATGLIAEADSGGHTDNRPAIGLLPAMLALRDRLARQFGHAPAPVGLGGGIATPAAVCAAFAMGAAFVVTGSVNQACVESGSCDAVRQMLAEAGPADVVMAPAADMFEMGVKVQVLKRGTMFAFRAAKLFELYNQHASLDDIPAAVRSNLEATVFRQSLDATWAQTKEFFRVRDPRQLERGEADPKHRMALVFRWYLGQASRWANRGVPDRKLDYQVWCGPAMGAFNEWAKDSFLADPKRRTVATVADQLLHGACYLTRLAMLRLQADALPPGLDHCPPNPAWGNA